MCNKNQPLHAAQRHQITGSLFWLLGAGAVATVAAPAVFPCPAIERTRNDDEQPLSITTEQAISRESAMGRGPITLIKLNTSAATTATTAADGQVDTTINTDRPIPHPSDPLPKGRVAVEVLPFEDGTSNATTATLPRYVSRATLPTHASLDANSNS
ncbi:hypothetical protein BDF19DRAFT_424845 [Syncephalis fuscata]|nr:hypothetical protein BDF19DRAFT_424845 [Syncephalis fuscata]